MTAKERLNDYEVALERLTAMKQYRKLASAGFCSVLPNVLIKENYPELYRYKPWYVKDNQRTVSGRTVSNYRNIFTNSFFWFGQYNHGKRIRILERIIRKMTSE